MAGALAWPAAQSSAKTVCSQVIAFCFCLCFTQCPNFFWNRGWSNMRTSPFTTAANHNWLCAQPSNVLLISASERQSSFRFTCRSSQFGSKMNQHPQMRAVTAWKKIRDAFHWKKKKNCNSELHKILRTDFLGTQHTKVYSHHFEKV